LIVRPQACVTLTHLSNRRKIFSAFTTTLLESQSDLDDNADVNIWLLHVISNGRMAAGHDDDDDDE
jgi:hypothetical protein